MIDEDNIDAQAALMTQIISRKWHSPQTDKIDEALAAAQGELTDIPKTHTANIPGRPYKYATKSDILGVVRPVLSKNGIALLTNTWVTDSGRFMACTRIAYKGQWYDTEWPLAAKGGDATNQQALGSALTYGSKYSICALLGIAPEDDDLDGIPAEVALAPLKRKPETVRNTTEEEDKPLPPRLYSGSGG